MAERNPHDQPNANDRGYLWDPQRMQRSRAYRQRRFAEDLAWLHFLRHTDLIDFTAFTSDRAQLVAFRESLERLQPGTDTPK